MWSATHRSARVLTVSEASKRDILRFFDVPESKIDVIYNAIDERFREEPPADEVMRVRERFQLNDPFVLYAGNIKPHKNLERLIEAFHSSARRRLRARQAADHRRRDLEVRDAAARRPPLQAAQARALPRLRARTRRWRSSIAWRGVRLPVALRRLRPAAARGDGQRHAGGHVERLVAARGGRRRGGAGRSVRPDAIAEGDAPRADGRPRCATTCASAAWRARASSRGSRSVRARPRDLRRGAGGPA